MRKPLVAYFSASGNTAELAKKLEDKRAADAKAVLEKDAAVSAELNSEV